MALTNTPVCEFSLPAVDFDLPGVDGRRWTLHECHGERATLVMFICNHCPYVQAIQDRLVRDARELPAQAKARRIRSRAWAAPSNGVNEGLNPFMADLRQ